MRVIVTRPEHDAERWCQDLSAHGFDAVALPLLAIGPATELAALQQIWRQLNPYLAVMFVSGNAVAQFFASKPPQAHNPWEKFATESGANVAWAPRCWAPGPATRQALQQAGVPPALVDAPSSQAGQFDSEALWQLVQPQVATGARVLIVRGSDGDGRSAGREWLGGRLGAAGARVDVVVAYQRQLPVFSPQQRVLAEQAASDGSVWLFSSSQAIGNLTRLLPAQDWSRARAVATHPRIAQAARDTGFGVVCESRPLLEDVVASIESVR